MSHHISSWAWKNKRAKGNARLLLCALADMANDEGYCWPSVASLMERINVTTDRCVQQLLVELEENGELSRHYRTGKSTIYQLLPPNGDSPRTVVHPEPSFTTHPNDHSPHPRTVVHPTPEPPFTQNHQGTIKEPSEKLVPVASVEAQIPNNPEPVPSKSQTRSKPELITDTPLPSKQSTEEWMAGLRADPAYSHVDIDHEQGKCVRWCQQNRKQATRARFVNWLNRIEKPLEGKAATNRPTTEQARANVDRTLRKMMTEGDGF